MLSRIGKIALDFAQTASVSTVSYLLFSQAQPCNSIAIVKAAELAVVKYLNDCYRLGRNFDDPIFGYFFDYAVIGMVRVISYPIAYSSDRELICNNDLSYFASTAMAAAPVVLIQGLLKLQDWCDQDIHHNMLMNGRVVDLDDPQFFF